MAFRLGHDDCKDKKTIRSVRRDTIRQQFILLVRGGYINIASRSGLVVCGVGFTFYEANVKHRVRAVGVQSGKRLCL